MRERQVPPAEPAAGSRAPLARLEHDLRAPLCAVAAMVEALADGMVSEPGAQARYYARIARQIAQVSSMVDDLFTLDRLGSPAPGRPLLSASLAELAADVVDATADLARARGVRLGGRLPAAMPGQLMSAGEVRRAVRNLVDNAVRHTPPGGAVWVEAGPEPAGGFVAVADACGGIPEQDLPMLFEPGFRGQADSGGAADGAGLGLAIVQAVARAHHGQVRVRNQGPGCCFVLQLPWRPPPAAPPAAPAAAGRPAVRSRRPPPARPEPRSAIQSGRR